MSENVADGTVETPNEDINWEERAKKAEAKIVELKKSSKEENTVNTLTDKPQEVIDANSVKEQLKREMALDSFIDSNPDFVEKRADIEKLTSNGLTFDEAKDVLIKRDPTIAERQKTNSMSMT